MSPTQEMLLKSHPPTAKLLRGVCAPHSPPGAGGGRIWAGERKVGRRKEEAGPATHCPTLSPFLPPLLEPCADNFPSPSTPSPDFSVWSSVLSRTFGLTVKAPRSLRSSGLGTHFLSREPLMPQPACLTCCSLCFAALALSVLTALLSRTFGSLMRSCLHAESVPGSFHTTLFSLVRTQTTFSLVLELRACLSFHQGESS